MKKIKITFFIFVITIYCIISCSSLSGKVSATSDVAKTPKNIILFIGDGMGLSQTQSAIYYKNGMKMTEAGEPFKWSFEKFPVFGYVTNYSSNSLVTDSAAAVTALACGVKTTNGAIGVDAEGKEAKSVAEYAKEIGKGVGVMSSVGFNHATPAGFYAHAGGRGDYDEIIDQALQKKTVDVLIGGGFYGKRWTAPELDKKAAEAGYKVFNCDNYASFDTASLKDEKVLGYFDTNDNKQLDYEVDRTADNKEPHLSDLTIKALDILKSKPKGFFLMVEGGAIDWACHENNFARSTGEIVEFDKSIEMTVEFLKKNKMFEDTLIVVTADHETGGMTIAGPYKKVLNATETPQLNWGSKDHTAFPPMVYAIGPGSELFSGKGDNTFISKNIMKLLK